ncbi:MAG: hypothetical protein R6W77_09955 [Trueperaceae bacterium]
MSPYVRVILAIGALAAAILVAYVVGSAGWLWVTLAGVFFLVLHARLDTYPFLVVGALLAGAGIGTLLEVTWRWSGAFLSSIGAAAITVEALAPRPGRWAFAIGIGLLVLGTVVGMADAGRDGLYALLLAAAIVGAGAALGRQAH